MAAVAVTSANNNDIANGNRVVVRNSSGIPYVVVRDSTDGAIEVWKGNSATPTSFTEQNTANRPAATGYGSMSAAIDSTGVIHIVFAQYVSTSDDLEYITFSTSTDTWGTLATINSDLGEESTSVSNIYTSIAIDSNNIPHVAYTGVELTAGTVGYVVRYNNRIGAAWNASGLEVEGQTSNKDCLRPDITIDYENIPVIAYVNEDDDDIGVARGNANDPTTFELYDVDADSEVSPGQNGVSVVSDTDGGIYIAYRDESDTYIYVNRHSPYSAWTTWGTRITNSNNGINPSIVPNHNGFTIVYEEDTTDDIVYDRYFGAFGSGNWLGETILESGTYNSPKAKYGWWVDNDFASGNLLAGAVLGRASGASQPPTNPSTASTNYGNFPALNSTGWKSVNITTLYNEWKAGTYTNYGLMVYPTNNSQTNGSMMMMENTNPAYIDVDGETRTVSDDSGTRSSTPSGYKFSFGLDQDMGFGGWGDWYYPILYFDLTDLPTTATTATLYIYSNGSVNDPAAYVRRITSQWYGAPQKRKALALDYAFCDETASPDVWFNSVAIYEQYTKGNRSSLPTDTTDLESVYNDGNMANIISDNASRVDQTGKGQYAIHMYKNRVTDSSATFTWNGQSDLAPSSSTVYLQVYNTNTTSWTTQTSNSVASASTDFTLQTTIADLTNYKDANGVVAFRVYQQMT